MNIASVSSITVAQTAEEKQVVACRHLERWKPTDLPRILEEHREWMEREGFPTKEEEERGTRYFPFGIPPPASTPSKWTEEAFSQGRADLCNADLRWATLNNADLRGAELNNAHLVRATLNNAHLSSAYLNNADVAGAELNNAHLIGATLNNAHLNNAELNNAHLNNAELNDAELNSARLNNADLREARLNNADLNNADLNNADLREARLNNAKLRWATLNDADLRWATLNDADLNSARLNNAKLRGANVDRAHLSYADVTGAIYAPASPPPDPYVAGIKGLQTVTFPKGEEIGLAQLRELIQKAGLRDLEREATYAIERGRTRHALAGWRTDPVHAAEGAFRFVAFDATIAYGLHPARALILIVGFWATLTMVYVWPIRLRSKRIRANGMYRSQQTDTTSGIYRIWPKDRIEARSREITADHPIKVERLQGGMWAALGWAAYFSLLSAFHIGFREFNVGTWLARLQFHRFVLEPEGWVRFVSGAQSLLSVYLLAIWALTYFGRLFQ